MRKLAYIVSLLALLAAFGWVALHVEFGGATLWDRVAGPAPPAGPALSPRPAAGGRRGGTVTPPTQAPDGPPMERLQDRERRDLERLIQERSR